MKAEWDRRMLGELCTFVRGPFGGSLKKSLFVEDGFAVYEQQHAIYNQFDEIRYFIDETKFAEMQRFELHPNDLIMSCSGTMGKIAIVPEYIRRGIINQALLKLTPSKAIDAVFLKYWMDSSVFQESLKEQSGGAAIQNVASVAVLKEIQIPIPSLVEQQRIVSVLNEAFVGLSCALANCERNVRNSRELFESHLNAIFSSQCSDELRLADVCTFSSGGTPSKKNSDYWRGEIPWVSGRDMKSTRLHDTTLHISQKAVDESSTRMAPAGTLLALVRGMGLAHGAQIVELLVPCAFNQDIRAIHPNRKVIPRYLLFALKTRINSCDSVMSNAAHGTMKIDMDELKNVRVPIRSLERQREIVEQIDSLFNETKRLESIYQRKQASLNELKSSLLHQAFSGQL